MELIKWNNSFSEDVKEITGDDTEEFIHKAKEKKNEQAGRRYERYQQMSSSSKNKMGR